MLKQKVLNSLVSQLLEKLGLKNVYISGGAGDKGIDIEAYTVDEQEA
jgi:hypothetical protein